MTDVSVSGVAVGPDVGVALLSSNGLVGSIARRVGSGVASDALSSPHAVAASKKIANIRIWVRCRWFITIVC